MAVATAAQVDHFLVARCAHQPGLSDPLVLVQEIDQQPFAVRRPGEVLVTVAVAVVAVAGQHGAALFAGHVVHAQGGPFLQIGHLLAIGRPFRLEFLGGRGQQCFLLQHGGGEEVGLLLAYDAGGVEVPAAIALGGVQDRSPIGTETGRTLLLGRVGDAARGALLHGAHEDLAAVHEHDLLPVGGDIELADATVHLHGALRGVAGVQCDPHLHLHRLRSIDHGVQFTMVAEAEQTVGADAQVTDGVVLQEGDLRGGATTGGHLVHVEGARARHGTGSVLAQVVHRAAIGGKHRFAVLAIEGGELLVGSRGGRVAPHVTRHAGPVVLAEIILVAFPIVEHQQASIRGVARIDRGRGQDALGLAAGQWHTIELAQSGARELLVAGGIQPAAGEDDRAVVRREVAGRITGGMEGEPRGLASRAGHHVHIVVAGAVAGKGDQPAITGPYRRAVVGFVGGEEHGIATGHGHPPQVAEVAEHDGGAVRGNGGLPHPEGRFLRDGGEVDRGEQKKQVVAMRHDGEWRGTK